MEVNPSWKQLASIPESAQKAAILKALDIVPPPEGVSDTFQDRGLYVRHDPASSHPWLVSALKGSDGVRLPSCLYRDGSAALKACQSPPGTPCGDALRAWMRSRGWVPANERKAPDPQEQTRTII